MPHGMGSQDYRSKRYKPANTGNMKSSTYGGSGYAEGGYTNKGPSTGVGLKPVMTTGGGYKGDIYGGKTFHNMSKGGNTAQKAQGMYGGTGQMGGDGHSKGGEPKFKRGYAR